jgi:hypothetical protein
MPGDAANRNGQSLAVPGTSSGKSLPLLQGLEAFVLGKEMAKTNLAAPPPTGSFWSTRNSMVKVPADCSS